MPSLRRWQLRPHFIQEVHDDSDLAHALVLAFHHGHQPPVGIPTKGTGL